MTKITTVLLIVVLFSGLVAAQTAATGAIVGTVTDQEGRLLPGAQVTLQSEDTGARRTSVTEAAGVYRFALLPPGKYSVEFSATGFTGVKTSNAIVNVSETMTVNAVLKVGTHVETVDVRESAVEVQKETSSLGTLVGHNEITNLPLTTRNYTEILHMSAGVTADLANAAQVGRGTQDVYVHGGRSIPERPLMKLLKRGAGQDVRVSRF